MRKLSLLLSTFALLAIFLVNPQKSQASAVSSCHLFAQVLDRQPIIIPRNPKSRMYLQVDLLILGTKHKRGTCLTPGVAGSKRSVKMWLRPKQAVQLQKGKIIEVNHFRVYPTPMPGAKRRVYVDWSFIKTSKRKLSSFKVPHSTTLKAKKSGTSK